MILFTGGQAQELDHAVLENALVRGRVAEQLAGRALFAKARDEIFVAGLFSLLDLVMHMPMEQVLKQISLPAEITEAILANKGPSRPIWRWRSPANGTTRAASRRWPSRSDARSPTSMACTWTRSCGRRNCLPTCKPGSRPSGWLPWHKNNQLQVVLHAGRMVFPYHR